MAAMSESTPVLQDDDLAKPEKHQTYEGVERNADDSPPSTACCCSLHISRILVYATMFVGMMIMNFDFTVMNVAMVAMVNQTVEDPDPPNASVAEAHGLCPRQPEPRVPFNGEFLWNSEERGGILAAYNYGIQISLIFGGLLADRIGGKWLMLIGVLTLSLTTLLTPVSTFNIAIVIIVRVICGIGAGFIYPAVHSLLISWTPLTQSTSITAIVYAGCDVGSVIGMLLTGAMCARFGWPSAFYLFGTAGMVWLIFCWFFIYKSPEAHPRISAAERRYLESQLAEDTAPSMEHKTPWRGLITSPPFLSLCLVFFVVVWTYITLLTGLPSFMTQVLGASVATSSILSSTPFVATSLSMPLGGLIADWLRARKKCTTTIVRKIYSVIGAIIAGSMVIVASHIGCNGALVAAVFFIAISGGAIGFTYVYANVLDIAGPYAGIVMGLCMFFGNIASIVTPLVTGALTGSQADLRSEWQNVFYTMAGILWAGTLVYLFFGSGERQKWSYPEHNEPPAKEQQDEKPAEPQPDKTE